VTRFSPTRCISPHYFGFDHGLNAIHCPLAACPCARLKLVAVWLVACFSRRCSQFSALACLCPAAMPLTSPRGALLGPGAGARARTCSRSRPAALESAAGRCCDGVVSRRRRAPPSRLARRRSTAGNRLRPWGGCGMWVGSKHVVIEGEMCDVERGSVWWA
jgi:hypothetical protein